MAEMFKTRGELGARFFQEQRYARYARCGCVAVGVTMARWCPGVSTAQAVGLAKTIWRSGGCISRTPTAKDHRGMTDNRGRETIARAPGWTSSRHSDDSSSQRRRHMGNTPHHSSQRLPRRMRRPTLYP